MEASCEWVDDHMGHNSYAPRKVSGFYTRDDLEHLHHQRQFAQPLEGVAINADIAGRGYQNEAIRRVTEGIAAAKREFLLVMATGTGKTRTTIALVDTLLRTKRVARAVLGRPSRVGQTGPVGVQVPFAHREPGPHRGWRNLQRARPVLHLPQHDAEFCTLRQNHTRDRIPGQAFAPPDRGGGRAGHRIEPPPGRVGHCRDAHPRRRGLSSAAFLRSRPVGGRVSKPIVLAVAEPGMRLSRTRPVPWLAHLRRDADPGKKCPALPSGGGPSTSRGTTPPTPGPGGARGAGPRVPAQTSRTTERDRPRPGDQAPVPAAAPDTAPARGVSRPAVAGRTTAGPARAAPPA